MVRQALQSRTCLLIGTNGGSLALGLLICEPRRMFGPPQAARLLITAASDVDAAGRVELGGGFAAHVAPTPSLQLPLVQLFGDPIAHGVGSRGRNLAQAILRDCTHRSVAGDGVRDGTCW